MKITSEKEKESKWKSRKGKEGGEKRYTDETPIDLEWLEMVILVNRKLPLIPGKKIKFLKI